MDNGLAFRSSYVELLCSNWNVVRRYRAAYRPSGNGIVELNHRTIKRIAARSATSPLQAVFWYNLGPDCSREESPADAIFRYKRRHPSAKPPEPSEKGVEECPFKPGDSVFVKPLQVTCTTKWKPGTVTGVISRNTVDVEGTPKHVLDIRRAPSTYGGRDFLTTSHIALPSSAAEDEIDLFLDARSNPNDSIDARVEVDEEQAETRVEQYAEIPGQSDEQPIEMNECRPVRNRRLPHALADFVVDAK